MTFYGLGGIKTDIKPNNNINNDDNGNNGDEIYDGGCSYGN